MHPRLLENATFLRYYTRWQEDPSSLVFLPIAEFFLEYGMVSEAVAVCELGLSYHPQLVSGQLTLAKALMRKGQLSEARQLAMKVLHQIPNHFDAKAILEATLLEKRHAEVIEVKPLPSEEKKKPSTHSWQTVTMANIYAAQGHYQQAEAIYQAILEQEPTNSAAKQGLEKISKMLGGGPEG